MSSSPPTIVRGAQPADAAITAEREETKYLVGMDRLPLLKRTIEGRLEPHRFTGEAANRLPGAEHFVTTIYFDTPSRHYFKAAQRDQLSNVKIRAKEYYDLHPSLAELATEPQQILRYQPWLWFEIKKREGPTTSKRRFRFPKAAAATLFTDRQEPEDLPQTEPERSSAALLIAHVRSQAERVVPSAVVNYRRLSYQNTESTLRVTIDVGLAFFPVPADLFRRERPLSRSELGRPTRVEQRAVVEVKRRCPLPDWLEQVLAESGGFPAPFSKFLAASEALGD